MNINCRQALCEMLLFSCATLMPAQAPPTSDLYLAKHNVPNTVAGLRAALASSDSEVRGVAAELLASRRDHDSIGLIEASFANEKSFQTRIALANALADLGNSTGTSWLAFSCQDSTLSALQRVLAAATLATRGDNSCTSSVVALLSHNPGTEETTLGLQYLTRARSLTPQDLTTLRSNAASGLRGSLPSTRWNAARILSEIGDSGSEAYLVQAASAEKDGEYKIRMEEQLRRLRARIRAASSGSGPLAP